MSIESANELVSKAKEIEEVSAQQLTADFFEHKTRKHIKSLGMDTDIVLNKHSLIYKLVEPYFVDSVEIQTTDSSIRNIKVSYKIAGQHQDRASVVKYSNNLCEFTISCYVSEINIVLDQGIVSSILGGGKCLIRNIKIYGINADGLIDAVNGLKNIKKIKQEIIQAGSTISAENTNSLNAIAVEKEQLIEARSELEDKIKEKISTLESLELSINESSVDLEKINDEVESKKNENSSLTRDIEVKKSHKSNLDSEISNLNSRKAELTEQVRKLNENKSLFTDEISSYAEQGRNSIGVYLAIIFIPTLVLAIMAERLLSNTIALASIEGVASIGQAFSYLVTRIPYAVVSITIIYACYGIISNIFDKIFYIHKSRLQLSSLSILAKDITDSSRSETQVSDEEVYSQRIKARMDLIKWHIQGMDSNSKIDLPEKSQEIKNNIL